MAARKRARPTISLTLNERTLTMLDAYASKHLGNRSEAADCIVGRYTYLTQEADLSSVSFDAFVMLCQINGGLITTKMVEPRGTLLAGAYQKLADQNDFRRTLDAKPPGFFRDDSQESRSAFIDKLNIEREHLNSVVNLVKSLDQTQSMALLEYVEQVLCGDDDTHIREHCANVYEQMQIRTRDI